MQRTINTKELRASFPKIVECVRKGEKFTVLYRSRPAFRIVPIDDEAPVSSPLASDPLYRAGALGAASDGFTADDHDVLLYGELKK